MPKTPQAPPPEDFLPLKPVEFLILMTVAAGERHGYGIMLDIAERTGGSVRLESEEGQWTTVTLCWPNRTKPVASRAVTPAR